MSAIPRYVVRLPDGTTRPATGQEIADMKKRLAPFKKKPEPYQRARGHKHSGQYLTLADVARRGNAMEKRAQRAAKRKRTLNQEP